MACAPRAFGGRQTSGWPVASLTPLGTNPTETDRPKMNSLATLLAMSALALALCCGLLVPATHAASDFAFSAQNFTNGTNLKVDFAASKDYASESINCTFTFPGELTFAYLEYSQFASFPVNYSFQVLSDISKVRCLSSLPAHTTREQPLEEKAKKRKRSDKILEKPKISKQ